MPSDRRRARGSLLWLVSCGVAVLALAGCHSDSSSAPDVQTVPAATPSPAPATPTVAPAGSTVDLPRGSSEVVASADRVAVIGPGGLSLLIRSTGPADSPIATVPTAGITALAPSFDGSGVVGAGTGEIVQVGADNRAHVSRIPARDVRAVAAASQGRILVGTADGHVLVYSAAGDNATLERDIGGFVRVDEISVSPAPDHQVLVLDRAQSSVTPITLADGKLGSALRAGNGATNATVDHFGRVSVANTRDDEIVGFYGDPLVMRFRYPVSGGPYAVDYDDTHDLLWVSTTANNEVVAYDLSSGEPAQKYRYPTVGQPDSIALDRAGNVYVLSAQSGRLQIITPGDITPSASPAG